MSCTSMPIMWPRPCGKKSACAPAATASSALPFIRPSAVRSVTNDFAAPRWTSRYGTPGLIAAIAPICARSTAS